MQRCASLSRPPLPPSDISGSPRNQLSLPSPCTSTREAQTIRFQHSQERRDDINGDYWYEYYLRGKLGGVGTFSSTFPPPLGMYVTFGFDVSDCTIALLASIFRNAMNPSPALSSALEMVAAASASP